MLTGIYSVLHDVYMLQFNPKGKLLRDWIALDASTLIYMRREIEASQKYGLIKRRFINYKSHFQLTMRGLWRYYRELENLNVERIPLPPDKAILYLS